MKKLEDLNKRLEKEVAKAQAKVKMYEEERQERKVPIKS